MPTVDHCPECRNFSLVEDRRDETFPFDLGDRVIEVSVTDVPIKKCSSCGEAFLGPEAVKLRHDAVVKAAGGHLPTVR